MTMVHGSDAEILYAGRLQSLVPYAKEILTYYELPKLARRNAGLTDAKTTPQWKAVVINYLSSVCNKRENPCSHPAQSFDHGHPYWIDICRAQLQAS